MISTTAVYTATVEDILGDRKHGCTITIEIAPSKNTKFKTVCDIFARFLCRENFTSIMGSLVEFSYFMRFLVIAACGYSAEVQLSVNRRKLKIHRSDLLIIVSLLLCCHYRLKLSR